MPSQPRIVITSRSRNAWERLLAEVTERRGEACLVVGKGERARKLIERLLREIPEAMRGPSFDGEHVAFVNPYGRGTPFAWGHDSPGNAPVVELTTQGCEQGCDQGAR